MTRQPRCCDDEARYSETSSAKACVPVVLATLTMVVQVSCLVPRDRGLRLHAKACREVEHANEFGTQGYSIAPIGIEWRPEIKVGIRSIMKVVHQTGQRKSVDEHDGVDV